MADPVLEELKARFDYATDEWRDIRKEADVDMRFVSGHCFDPAAKKAREDAKRPVIEPDELSQYLNQLVNDVRQNKRGVNVTAVGDGANDKTAAFLQGKIRDIEYRSNAQQAYTTMGENAFQRSYGYLRIAPRYVDDTKGFDQELFIEPVVNPNLVTPDPDAQRSDGSDLKYLFFHESRLVKEFTREFPDATVTAFGAEQMALAPSWIKGGKITIAEYWVKAAGKKRTLLLLKPSPRTAQNPNPQPLEVFKDELHTMPSSDHILKSREIADVKVTQYLTNGLEILKTTPWPGKSIPFVTCYGKILYLDEGEGTKKKILSLIRLARSPQQLYAYYRTQQAEMAGMIPKAPVMGYKGQFRGVEYDWQKAPHEPMAFLEANATTPETGAAILPLPTRLAYEAGAHLQALELCAEGARRAIQAAIAVSALPTAAQRQNEKSGVALQRIDSAAQKGSFHFIDHYDEGITRTGEILKDLIPHYYDTARDTSIRNPDDSPSIVRINDPDPQHLQEGQEAPIDAGVGRHDVTISVGPAKDSEREAADDFADALIQTPAAPLVMDLVVKLKNLGPIGDEMAERLTPPQFKKNPTGQPDPQQVLSENQALKQQVAELQPEKLKTDAAITMKQMDNANAIELQKMKDATTIRAAQIAASTKGIVSANEARDEAIALQTTIAADAEAAAHDRAHEAGMAAMGAAHSAQATDQAHEHALEQGDAAAANQAAVAQAQPAEGEAGA